MTHWSLWSLWARLSEAIAAALSRRAASQQSPSTSRCSSVSSESSRSRAAEWSASTPAAAAAAESGSSSDSPSLPTSSCGRRFVVRLLLRCEEAAGVLFEPFRAAAAAARRRPGVLLGDSSSDSAAAAPASSPAAASETATGARSTTAALSAADDAELRRRRPTQEKDACARRAELRPSDGCSSSPLDSARVVRPPKQANIRAERQQPDQGSQTKEEAVAEALLWAAAVTSASTLQGPRRCSWGRAPSDQSTGSSKQRPAAHPVPAAAASAGCCCRHKSAKRSFAARTRICM